jgi:hypothetical protein
MHHLELEMHYTLFNCWLERPNADYLLPSFELGQADREFLLELRIFLQGDAINQSLQLGSDPLRLSQAPGHHF